MDYAVGVREGRKLWILTKGIALHGNGISEHECWMAYSFCARKGLLQYVPRGVCGPWFFDKYESSDEYAISTSRYSSNLRFGSHWRIYG